MQQPVDYPVLDALDNKWLARRFRTGAWSHRLPRRLAKLLRKLAIPSWYGYQLRRWLSKKDR